MGGRGSDEEERKQKTTVGEGYGRHEEMGDRGSDGEQRERGRQPKEKGERERVRKSVKRGDSVRRDRMEFQSVTN